MSKLFLSDLDGTLLNDDKLVGDATKRALAGFIDRGNHMAFCSGRALYNVMLVYNTLFDLPRCYAIGYNGAGIYDIGRGEEIYRKGVPLDMVRIFFALGKKYDIHCQTYSDENILTTKRSEALAYYNRYIDQNAVISDDVVSLLDKEPCKCLAIELHDHERQERFRQELEDATGGMLTLMYSNPYYLEVIHRDAGKGRALERLASHLGIPVSDTVAAGDQQNDIPMIEAAGLGIAMANASDEVKRIADVVTGEDNNHDGLVPFFDAM